MVLILIIPERVVRKKHRVLRAQSPGQVKGVDGVQDTLPQTMWHLDVSAIVS